MATELGSIYRMHNSKMVRLKSLTLDRASRPNFVIVCSYGDWSGFRTLAACEKQFSELEENVKDSKRPNGFYWVEER